MFEVSLEPWSVQQHRGLHRQFRSMRLWLAAGLLAAACHPIAGAEARIVAVDPAAASPDPALRLHGHNDYLQPVPCRRALELGLGSFEADIFLEEGELRVGHETWQLRAGRTLRSLYLEPLQRECQRRGGRLLPGGQPLVLLVDIKRAGDEVYPVLRRELCAFAPMLTRFVAGRIEPGAVTVLLSGDRPVGAVADEAERWWAIDGRLDDLDREPSPPADLVPWVSSPFRAVSDWTGSDELMADELARITGLVARAEAQGRELRFWSAPDRKEGWAALFDLGVHRIGSDQPKNAVRWLRAHRAGGGGRGSGDDAVRMQ